MVRVSIATYLVVVLAVPVSAAGQAAQATSQQDQRERSVAAAQKTSIADAASEQLRRSLLEERGDTAVASADRQVSSANRRHRSVGRKILGGAIGGVGGFFGGGYLGAKIDGQCDCDDPGFKGFLIGAPIGAVAGAILGAIYF